MGQKTVL